MPVGDRFLLIGFGAFALWVSALKPFPALEGHSQEKCEREFQAANIVHRARGCLLSRSDEFQIVSCSG